MKDYNEKRSCQRCTYEAPITCAYFNADKFYRAKTINHSKNGMYFKSDFPLKPGASIYIRVESYPSESFSSGVCCCGGARMLALGEVRWCEEIKGADAFCYGVGLKYYEPAI